VRRLLLVANPNAKDVTGARRDAIALELASGFDVDVATTERPGHAVELAREAGAGGVDILAVLGGDGTINEAVNGLVGSGTVLSIIPAGGANVMAGALGIPGDGIAAARLLVARSSIPPRTVPLGRIDERLFTSSCGMGFDAAIVQGVENNQRWKKRAGDLYFVWQGLRQFFVGYDRRHPQLTLRWREGPLERQHEGIYLAIVQNLDPFTYLGSRPLRICPDAKLEGGLDCFALDSMRTLPTLGILFSAFGSAKHTGKRHAVYLRDLPALEITSRKPLPVQADGEYLGHRMSVRIESLPDALAVLY
jgi:diacylglycerol kinase family enzyme